jgi:hypothetical protein
MILCLGCFALGGICGNPIQEEKAAGKIREYSIECIAHRMGVPIDRHERLRAKSQRQHYQHYALPGNRVIGPTPAFEPDVIHSFSFGH